MLPSWLDVIRHRPFAVALSALAVACGSPQSSPPQPPAPAAEPAASAAPTAAEGDAGGPAVTSEPATTEPSAGESDPQVALATAKKDGRPALVVFCAKWVAACGEIAHVLVEASVKKTLEERFVVARVDVSNEDDAATKERMKKYNVKGLPFMIVFDRKGKEVARESGYVDAPRVSKLLEKAK